MSQVSSELGYKIQVSDLSRCVAIWCSREGKREGFMITNYMEGSALEKVAKMLNSEIYLLRALNQRYYIWILPALTFWRRMKWGAIDHQ